MKLPEFIYSDRIRDIYQVKFGGINRKKSAADGEIYDMENLCGDDYPLLKTRKKRQIYKEGENGEGIYCFDKLLYCDKGKLYYDGKEISGLELTAGEKSFGALGAYIVIMPDKKYYNTLNGTHGDIESIFNPQTKEDFSENPSESTEEDSSEILISFQDGTYKEEPAKANTIYINSLGICDKYFSVGDAVTISGATGEFEVNNQMVIIREIEEYTEEDYNRDNPIEGDEGTTGAEGTEGTTDTEETDGTENKEDTGKTEESTVKKEPGTYLRFYENTFKKVDNGKAMSGITIARTMPDIKYMCQNENRLWGCDGDTIYASKPGDIFNWNVFDGLASDSYAVQAGSPGEFTGCCSYLGYPIFFKEDFVYKVYGNIPSNFEVMGSATYGVMKGSSKSLAVAGEVLFYLSPYGVCAYTGGIPRIISDCLGEEQIRDGIGGSDGIKYYIACSQEGENKTYFYDTRSGNWYREDAKSVAGFAKCDGKLYMQSSDGKIYTEGEGKEEIQWSVCFADFYNGSINKKGISKINVRLELFEEAEACVYIQFDSDGEWRIAGEKRNEKGKRSFCLPIIPRRADHYKIKIEGKGKCIIHALEIEGYTGSKLKSLPGKN